MDFLISGDWWAVQTQTDDRRHWNNLALFACESFAEGFLKMTQSVMAKSELPDQPPERFRVVKLGKGDSIYG